MSGEGITGLDSIRATLADQGAMLARIDERTQSQGQALAEHRRAVAQRFDEQGTTIDRISRKVDAAVQTQVETAGAAAGRRGTLTGAKDVLATLAAIAGVVTAIIVAAVK